MDVDKTWVVPDGTLAGGGELGARMRATDWAATPLGPVEGWPRALKTCVRILLTSRQPMWLGWGDTLTYLYNDPYKAIIGGKHSWALGRPTAEVWREIWADIEPRIRAALTGVEGTYDEALLLLMERYGYPEETYYTFSYSPVPDDEGRVRGIFCANTDDTRRIVGERQLALLRELAADTAEARTIADAAARSARALGTNPRDLPFALLYLIAPDGRSATLAGATGIAAAHPAAPGSIALDAAPVWPIAAALRAHEPLHIDDLATSFAHLPAGAWDRPPARAVALPIAPPGETGQAGVLIVGLNPYRLYDDDYARFLGLVAVQIAAAFANARAYQEERRRAETLAELDRAKTAFFANVSHEFRTPLTLLLGPLEDALAGEHDPGRRSSLETAHRNGLRLLRLVNGLLDFSRIEAGRVRASFAPTDPAALTADLASTFRSALERAGLRLDVRTPPLPEGTEVYLDREMWEQIVLNLLSNAFKFTFAGGIAVAVRPSTDRRAVELTVRDTGTGIPAGELPRLFERFHRVQGARARTHEGTGIGLALVQELVQLHGGTIAVASEEGRGTTFTVTIPTGSAHLPPEQIGARRDPDRAATGAAAFVEEALRWLPDPTGTSVGSEAARVPGAASAGARVLLADDNADMRDYVARLLRERYTVEAVADGEAALAAALALPPDLVLADVMMPRRDGFGLLRALRDDPRTHDVPVLLLSARAGEEARVEGLDAGADDYLIKPFGARELLARVGAHVSLRRARAEAQAALRDREAYFRTLADTVPAMIWLTDPTGACVYLNRRWLDFTGQTLEQGLGLGWLTKVHPEDAAESERIFLEANARRVPFGLDYRLQRRDGTYCWAADTGLPRFDADGTYLGYAGAVIDITARKEAEAALRASEARLRLALDVAGLGTWSWDLATGEGDIDDRGGALVGLAPGALPDVASSQRERVHPDDLPRLEVDLAAGVAAGDAFDLAYRVVTPDGETRHVATRARVLSDEAGRLARLIGTNRDVTAERRAAEERERLLAAERAARAEAEEAVRARDTFLSIAAHELRTPVTGLKGAAQLLLRRQTRDTLDPEQLAHGLRSLERSAGRLAALTDDLLDVARIRTGQLSLDRAPIDLVALVREAVAAARDRTNGDHRLAFDAPDALPPVSADAGRIEQVLTNLLDNAIKYSPGGGEIAVAVRVDGAGAAVTVRDGGIGLPPGTTEAIFAPFGRATNAAASNLPGMGLGLHICRNIAERHGGWIRASSDGEGRGTTLTLWLPFGGPPKREGDDG